MKLLPEEFFLDGGEKGSPTTTLRENQPIEVVLYRVNYGLIMK